MINLKNIKMSSLCRMIKETKHYNILIIAMLALISKAVLCQAVTFFLGNLVDAALHKEMTQAFSLFAYLIAGILILLVMELFNNGLFGKYANESFFLIREKTIKVIETLPFTTISRYSTGDLISRMNNDLGLIERFYRSVIQDTGYYILDYLQLFMVCLLIIK